VLHSRLRAPAPDERLAGSGPVGRNPAAGSDIKKRELTPPPSTQRTCPSLADKTGEIKI
jgi:hypothetical protein